MTPVEFTDFIVTKFPEYKKELKEYFNKSKPSFKFPNNIVGTNFQIAVWKEIFNIPYGKTRSYKQIAELIQNPLAHRAVANACNKNPFPVIIPCHRVTGSNNYQGGYAYGLHIKNFLLDIEK